jgi:hypothetical protein
LAYLLDVTLLEEKSRQHCPSDLLVLERWTGLLAGFVRVSRSL